jgi:hypothetical protein
MAVFDGSNVLLYVHTIPNDAPAGYRLLGHQNDLIFRESGDGVAMAATVLADYSDGPSTALIDAYELELDVDVCYVEPASVTGKTEDLATFATVMPTAVTYGYPDCDAAWFSFEAAGDRPPRRVPFSALAKRIRDDLTVSV